MVTEEQKCYSGWQGWLQDLEEQPPPGTRLFSWAWSKVWPDSQLCFEPATDFWAGCGPFRATGPQQAGQTGTGFGQGTSVS